MSNEYPFRPPAIPLIAVDPYFSIWSFADRLTADVTRHWTGATQQLTGLIRVDGKCRMFCGVVHADPDHIPALPQTNVVITATRTCYTFEGDGIRLALTFMTPAIPEDLDLLGRPVTYLAFEVCSTDGREHEVSLFWSIGGEVATDSVHDMVSWGRVQLGDLDVIRLSHANQQVLGRAGDNLRIEWGNAYLSMTPQTGTTHLGDRNEARRYFIRTGELPVDDDTEQPRLIISKWPALNAVAGCGVVGVTPVRRHITVCYDDIYSVEYLHRKLRPWWRRNGATAADMLLQAEREYDMLCERCGAYDAELARRLEASGGAQYASLCVLAFRQCLAAHKLVADLDGSPLYFSKENFSNGCIATVDVTYPSAPFFLALNPDLLQAQLDPILHYAALPNWKFPFAPHDLGAYPLANGQIYGGGELSEECQMPVEECGNMLILVAALSLRDGAQRAGYVRRWWQLLSQWAAYLEAKGMDPGNQLCTDDFAGHLSHNANLSLKAIIALGCYAKLAGLIGESQTQMRIYAVARQMAEMWQAMADDGDHYRLAFDREGSWSQKYNLIWDRLLGLGLFPAVIAETEMAFYRRHQNRYGLPLDSRKSYTKLDWIFWTACLTNNQDDFLALTEPVYRWINEGTSRVPLTDWYETTGEGQSVGFQARPVVGGIFIRLLDWLSSGTTQRRQDKDVSVVESVSGFSG